MGSKVTVLTTGQTVTVTRKSDSLTVSVLAGAYTVTVASALQRMRGQAGISIDPYRLGSVLVAEVTQAGTTELFGMIDGSIVTPAQALEAFAAEIYLGTVAGADW
jgi:hypothetical protein